MNRNSLNALAYISLFGNFLVLFFLIGTMAVMSWFGKGWDATFITFISTLVGLSFGWTGMAFAWKFGSSQSEASKNEQDHEAVMANTVTSTPSGGPIVPPTPSASA